MTGKEAIIHYLGTHNSFCAPDVAALTGATVTSINQAAAKMARAGLLVIEGKVWRTVYYRFATREEREGKMSTNLIFKECRQSAAMKRVLPCISCGTLTSAQWDAGHYRTTAAAPQLRFNERNIHKQCVVCNQHKSGNLVPYRVELISRIGQEAVDEIESNHNRHRWTIEECKAIKAEYQQKLKDLRNSRSEAA
ncbi:TPA: recombination protein NinG [Escherichia coli]|nr:recombination protein NinG [Escherichia coli]